ncbi:M48 family metallopeptidase [Streptacidiphilus melanogenes]|uniref:M48 family metallopeptidase n=1 Tax=Streptacidiphilus melanogenes TaxID=411235 RepID=UPI001364A573|nr:M48 family metallopeptidase [Streptacidiphilus melanogenes]
MLPESQLKAAEKKGKKEGNGLRQRLDRALEERLFDEAVSGKDLGPRRDAAHYAAVALALPVHLVTLAALVSGCLLIAYGAWPAWIGALALFAVAYAGRPRLGSYRRFLKRSTAVTRQNAPALWDLADSVADGIGTRRADAILIDGRYNAGYTRVGLRRRVVLRIGMPMWASLREQERVALLAHEFGHGANGDARRGIWLGAALEALVEWVQGLRANSSMRSRRRGMEAVVALVVSWLTAGIAQLVLLYARLLHWLTRMGSRRAEYLADSFTTRLAGTEGAVGLVEALRLGTAYESVVHQRKVAGQRVPGRWRRGAGAADEPATVAEAPKTDLWTQIQEYVRSIPAAERTRRILAAELTHSDFDGTHPPSHLRLAFVRRRDEAAEPAVLLSPEASAAIDAELRLLARPIADDLLGV